MGLDDDYSSATFAYPNQFPATVSHREIPSEQGLARDNALLIGSVFTPFLPFVDRCHLISSTSGAISEVDGISRCNACGAYVNSYCEASTLRWICSLCHEKNVFKKAQRRYRSTTNLPELASPCVDFALSGPLQADKPLVHIFLVQEFMRSDALSAALDALSKTVVLMHDDVRVLLMTYSGNRIGVFNFKRLPEGDDDGLLTGAAVVHVNICDSDGSRSLDAELASLYDFASAVEPLSSCRELLLAILPSLLDQYSCGDYCDPAGSSVQELQPVIEALADWLTGPKSGGGDAAIAEKKPFILSLFGSEEEKVSSDIGCAADRCVGVVLQLFLSAGAGGSSSESHGWLSAAARRMCLHGVSTNIWCIVGGAEEKAGLGDLLPLAVSSGGRLQRFVLGDYAADERARLQECLRRALTRQIATRCLLRLRAPDLFDLRGGAEGAGQGHFLCDDELPGIMRMAACYSDSALTFPLAYSDRAAHASGMPFIVIQLAMSYETLVEAEGSEGEGNDSDGHDHGYLLHVARLFDAEPDFHRLLAGGGRHGGQNYGSLVGDQEVYYTDNVCCFDRRRRLRSSRRFRLINLRVPLTTKLYRAVTMQNARTSALLAARQVFGRPKEASGSELISTDVSLVIDQVVALVIAVIVSHRERVGERASALPVVEAIEQVGNSGALRLMFGIVGLVTHHRCGSRCDMDGAAAFLSLLNNVDASNVASLLYGKLFAVRSAPFGDSASRNEPHALLADPSRPLALQRSSLMLSNAQAYFIDNGTEFVLYRALVNNEASSSNLEAEANRKYLLLNYCRNRINTSPIVPSVVSAEAGTSSAALFSKCLIEDESKYAITMQKFTEIIERRVTARLS